MNFNSIDTKNLLNDLEEIFSKYNLTSTVKISKDEMLFTLKKVKNSIDKKDN